jgi:predicted ATP-dependent endonuclease of OLD family
MNQLEIKSFGPIEEANVQFGDLTLLVGAQASGKSIFLQLLTPY